jgi:ABC-type polysaccharide/polyol phosphate export permease
VCIGGSLSWTVLFLPVAYLLLFIFAFGFGLIMSVATVFFRDLQYINTMAMQALFFLTPILYKQDVLSGKLAFLVHLNPMSTFIDLFRSPLYLSTFPSLLVMLKAIIFSLMAMSLGLFFFLRQEKKLVFRL